MDRLGIVSTHIPSDRARPRLTLAGEKEKVIGMETGGQDQRQCDQKRQASGHSRNSQCDTLAPSEIVHGLKCNAGSVPEPPTNLRAGQPLG